MGKTKPAYCAEFKEQLIELVRAGGSPKGLAGGFGCSDASIKDGLNAPIKMLEDNIWQRHFEHSEHDRRWDCGGCVRQHYGREFLCHTRA